jgi:hypothetical protein
MQNCSMCRRLFVDLSLVVANEFEASKRFSLLTKDQYIWQLSLP